MDVKIAFLNGDLNEKIYMDQLKGFIVPRQESKAYKLVKSLYGLKQAPIQWYEKFDSVMISNGFKINEYDKCVYVKNTKKWYVIVCFYADDMLIIGSNNEIIKTTKKMLNSKIEMKDMSKAYVILWMKIIRTSDGYALSQSHYIGKSLEKFNKNNLYVTRTPVNKNIYLTKNIKKKAYHNWSIPKL